MAIVDVRQSDPVAGDPEGAVRPDAQGAAAAPRACGCAAERADALVHGVIAVVRRRRSGRFSANPQQAVTARRRLQITVEVEIVDQSNGKVL